jgi:site-specific DNA-methyltransferase (cytosine-N4-specific)
MKSTPKQFLKTKHGQVFLGDSLDLFASKIDDASVDLIMTSPPFGLVRKKDYGNVDAGEYVEWFKPFAKQFHRALKDTGSLVIDIGGSWIPGQPTRSLYHYELLITLCKEFGFHLAQEFFWWNPARLPTPAEWVTVRRIRVKDAINCVWWLSKTPWPKASNRRVLVPYSEAMRGLLKNGYKPKLRPSGHDISEKFSINNGAAIPPNLIAIAHTESNSAYIRYCAKIGLKPHPARFPVELPEFFIRMLTDRGDMVVDPFGGSCVTGEACERLKRSWICCEIVEDYLTGAVGRFSSIEALPPKQSRSIEYKISHPSALWNGDEGDTLSLDGGKTRGKPKKTTAKEAKQ